MEVFTYSRTYGFILSIKDQQLSYKTTIRYMFLVVEGINRYHDNLSVITI